MALYLIREILEGREHDAALIRSRRLYRVYERDQKVASISYAVMLIFKPIACTLT
jgi:hypothetical protein